MNTLSLGHIQRFTRYCATCKHQWVFAFDWRNNITVITALHDIWMREYLENTRGCHAIR